MQIKGVLTVSLLCLIIASCASQQEKVPASLMSTNTPMVIFTAQSTSTQLSPALTKAPVVLMEEQQINSYIIRVRRDMTYPLDRVVIEKNGEIKFESGFGAWVKIMDVTNDNEPEIVVWQYDGGMHGIFHVWVFMTDNDFSKILEAPPSMCEGKFKDLNNDGILEFQTCDQSFVYYNARCTSAGSAYAGAIFEFKKEQGYKLATLKFPQIFDEAIALHTKWIQNFQPFPGSTEEILHDETQCLVLHIVLDYLYSGQHNKAWKVLEVYYPFEDLNSFKSDILQKARNSPFFVEP